MMARKQRLRRAAWRLWVELPLIVWMVFVWGALWSDFSAANLLFGLLISLVVVRLFRLPPVRLSGRFDVLRAVAFVLWFIGQILRGSFEVLWVAARKGPRVKSAVVEVPLRTRDDLMLTAIGHVASLIPGSLVIDVDRRHGTLYLHVLNVETLREVDDFRASVVEIERRLIWVMGSKEELQMLRDEDLRVAQENVAARRAADGWRVTTAPSSLRAPGMQDGSPSADASEEGGAR